MKQFEGYDFIEEEGGIRAYRLTANDLEVLLAPCGAAPVSTFMVTYHVGSRNETLGVTGATHFLEHMMFKGTAKYSKQSGSTIFNVLQARGAHVNASTWNDRTNYYELLPSEHLSLAVDIEADRMRGLLLDPDEVQSERTVILNEFDQGENDPFRKLYHAVWSTAFEAHPYHHPTIGWRRDIESVTAAGLRSFYDRFYWPNNATVSVIGGFNEDTVMKDVLTKFGAIPRGDVAEECLREIEPEQRGERRTTIRMAGGVRAIIIGYKCPEATHSDWPALQLLSMVLSNGKSSRLAASLIDTGLASMQSASPSSFRDPGLFTVMAMLTPGTEVSTVEKSILEELETLKNVPVSGEEIKRALKKHEAHTLYARDGSYSLASELNEAIAAGDWKLYSRFLEMAKQVSVGDIQRVANLYFVRDTKTVGVYEPLDQNQDL